MIEILGKKGEGGDIWHGVCDTEFVLEDEFIFGLIESKYDCLFPFEDQVMVVDELVFGKAGDEVGFADPLRALSRSVTTTIMYR